jgi:Contractile injection system tape measure protein
MSHLIRTQIIDVTIARQDEPFALQQKLSDWYYQMIVPALQKTFDEVSADDEVIYLDRLEMDLGTINVREIGTHELSQKIATKIKDEFLAVSLSDERKKKSKRTTRLSVTQQWIYYMHHGYLHWSTVKTDTSWYELVLEGFATDSACIESLRRLLTTDVKAVKRIVLLSTFDFLVHLTEALTSEKQTALQQVMEAIGQTWEEVGKGHEAVILKRKIWEELLRAAAGKGTLTSEPTMQRLVYLHAAEREISQLNQKLSPNLTNWIVKPPRHLETTPDVYETPAKTGIPLDAYTINKSKIPDGGLFVQHAGLVLLHPFLNNLFTFLGLVNEGAFVARYSQQKALAVLHFLSTGSVTCEEHELVVPKILCNFPIGELIEPDVPISVQEQEECATLLEEVIARWSILKNTSPDGLRANFLQRSGKLYTLGNEPHLLMEANVLDVLLDRLPWGVGIIKLPWMTQLLKVEWR